MAGPDLLTKDDVPLHEIADTAVEMLDIFNDDASRGFVDMVSREVDSRTFMARTGNVSWDEIAEMEHATTASLDEYHMAFDVKTYAKSLGLTREFIEDSPRDYIEDHVAEVIEGGRQQMFDVTFNTMTSGIADGTALWYTPDDFGDNSFSNTHNHTYTSLLGSSTGSNTYDDTSKSLFSDGSAHTPTNIVRELTHELTEHGYTPDMALTTPRMADYFIEERSTGHGSNYYAPQAEQLENSLFEDSDRLPVQPAGVTVMQTEWLSPTTDGGHPIYMYDTSRQPVQRNTVRPMEFTDNTGNPVGGAGGFRGDPGALLGAYGTMRFGTKFEDPLAGTVVEEILPADITLS